MNSHDIAEANQSAGDTSAKDNYFELPAQDVPSLDRIANSLKREFKPQTPSEYAFVDTMMALARWQQTYRHQDDRTRSHCYRNPVSAERRFSRVMRDLEFLHRNSFALHELQSAAAPRGSKCAENVEIRNEPEQLVENRPVTDFDLPQNDIFFPKTTPETAKIDSISTDSAMPLDAHKRSAPDAHHAVAVAPVAGQQ